MASKLKKIRDIAPVILMREDAKKNWRQYLIISDERVVILDMVPAMIAGWNFKRRTIQGAADWPGKTRDQIVAWKMHNDDGKTTQPTLSETYRDKLLALSAGAGS